MHLRGKENILQPRLRLTDQNKDQIEGQVSLFENGLAE